MNRGKHSFGLVRTLLITVILCCILNSFAAADLYAPFSEESAEGKVAGMLADKLGIPLVLTGEGTSDKAANRMLGDPGALLFDSQSAPIAGLQGYTDEDLRTAMVPICLVAESPLYIVMDTGKAEQYGICDAATLTTYISENEYELTFARHTGADVTDRAVTLLGNEMAVLTDYFLPEEIPDVLRSGEADGAIMTGAELAENKDDPDLLVLCCLGRKRSKAYPDIPCAAEAGIPECRGEMLYLFTSAKTEPAETEQYEQIVSGSDLLLPKGFEQRLLTGNALMNDVRELFSDLKEYMTSEGLFFYEE